MKLIVYDFDGTLVDSRRDIAEAVNYMRRSLGGGELTLDEVIACTGNGADDLVRRTSGDLAGDFSTARKIFAEFYGAHPSDHTVLYPGVLEGLKKLHEAGFRQAVTSNKLEPLCRMGLERLGAAPWLDEIVGDGRYRLKPDPEPLLAVQQMFGAETENCWMVGDSWTDLAAGRRAGFKRVLAAYGFGEVQDEVWDFRVERFDEFVELMLKEV